MNKPIIYKKNFKINEELQHELLQLSFIKFYYIMKKQKL